MPDHVVKSPGDMAPSNDPSEARTGSIKISKEALVPDANPQTDSMLWDLISSARIDATPYIQALLDDPRVRASREGEVWSFKDYIDQVAEYPITEPIAAIRERDLCRVRLADDHQTI